jgi:hypothetical protein
MGAVVILSVFAYQGHNNRRLNKQDRISCANRRILIANQKIVLDVLAGNIATFIAFDNLAPMQRRFFRHQLATVTGAQANLAATPSCEL